MSKKQRSIILVCHQIENNMRLWRFEKQAATNPGISEGNTNLDSFLFSWYEHGSITDDLLDNNIYLTYENGDDRPEFGPVALLTIDDLFDNGYIDEDHLGHRILPSADDLEQVFVDAPGYLKGLDMERLNELVTDIVAVGSQSEVQKSLPDLPWVERSILLCMARYEGCYYQEETIPVLNETRTKVIGYKHID